MTGRSSEQRLTRRRFLRVGGAIECTVPAQPAIRIRDERNLRLVRADRFAPHDAKLTAVHPMGTLRMGADARASATDPRGAHHQLRGLWVADGSLFPTSIGVPPQISVYAFARAVAAHVAEDHG